jgi:hypothetical protein
MYYTWGWGGPRGQSGHIAVNELNRQPPISLDARAGNGKPARNLKAPNGRAKTYRVLPRPIEPELTYIGPVTKRTYTYWPYGTPGGKYGVTDYTNLSWSWVNVSGGGIVRTMVKRGDLFVPSAVKPITITSSAGNGWVKAIYGYVSTGSQRLYGWLAYAHQLAGKETVYHVTCANC